MTAFGLKKPVNIFWPAAEPPEDVDTADLERFVDAAGRGWERLREAVRGVWFFSVTGTGIFLVESVDPKAMCVSVDSVA